MELLKGMSVNERPCDSQQPRTVDAPRHQRVYHGWLETMFLGMRGLELKYITKKTLTSTDLTGHQNRLLLPKEETKEKLVPYLTSTEKLKVEEKGGEGLTVRVLDALGREYEMKFKFWTSSKAYIVNGKGWKEFMANHKHLEEGDDVHLYAFRITNNGGGACESEERRKLCMAMTVESEGEKEARKEKEEEEMRVLEESTSQVLFNLLLHSKSDPWIA